MVFENNLRSVEGESPSLSSFKRDLFSVTCSLEDWNTLQKDNTISLESSSSSDSFSLNGINEISKILISIPTNQERTIELNVCHDQWRSMLKEYSWEELCLLGKITNRILTVDLFALSPNAFPLHCLIYSKLGIHISGNVDELSIVFVGNKIVAPESDVRRIMYIPRIIKERDEIVTIPFDTCVPLFSCPFMLNEIILIPLNTDITIHFIECFASYEGDMIESYSFSPKINGNRNGIVIPLVRYPRRGLVWSFHNILLSIRVRYTSSVPLQAKILSARCNGIRFRDGMMTNIYWAKSTL
jgi:hypothetical protein